MGRGCITQRVGNDLKRSQIGHDRMLAAVGSGVSIRKSAAGASWLWQSYASIHHPPLGGTTVPQQG
jgi:hypothetical protein